MSNKQREMPLRMRRVLAAAAEETSTTVSAIVTSERSRHATAGRALACLRLRRLGFSFPEIGRLLKMHHTSVMAACRRAEGLPSKPRPPTKEWQPDLSGEWAI